MSNLLVKRWFWRFFGLRKFWKTMKIHEIPLNYEIYIRMRIFCTTHTVAFYALEWVIYLMDSSKTKQKGVDPNSINPSFFAFRNIPNNVCIQRKLRSWRIWKSKKILIFDAFLYPKRPKSEKMDFGQNGRPKLIFC